MSRFVQEDKIIGILFHDSDSRLCVLDDSGKHAVVVESEDGMLSFVNGIMTTDVKVVTWDGASEPELWESGVYGDLLHDLEQEGDIEKINLCETVHGALLIRE